jgi:hypothetical protein
MAEDRHHNKDEATNKRVLRTREEVVQDILRASEVTSLSPEEEEADEIRLIAQSLQNRKGSFGLHFAVCDDSARQQEITRRLSALLVDQELVELELSGDEKSLLDTLYSAPGKPAPLVVYGIEKLLPQGNELVHQLRRQDTLQEMQMRREQFRSLGRPLLLWMAEYVYTLIGQQAVDFWSWQGGAAFFTSAAPTPYFSASGSSIQLPQFSEQNTIRKVQQGFVGREEEIKQITAMLSEQQSVLIYGLPGVGKTDLALTVADCLSAEYPDARLYVPLRGSTTNPEDPLNGIRMIIQAFMPLQILPDNQDELLPIYHLVLGGKRALIILDDTPSATVTSIFAPPKGSALIATSRRKLSIPSIQAIRLGTLKMKDSQRLLQSFCSRVTNNEAEDLASLCGFMPVALRIAGSRLARNAHISPTSYAAELRAGGLRSIATPHESLEIFFNKSYNALNAETARVFRQLSVFSNDFDAETEAVVCEDRDNTHLHLLVEGSLVSFDEDTDRYRMIDLLRQYAAGLLSREEQERATQRAVIYYLHSIRDENQLRQEFSREDFWSVIQAIAQPIVRRYAMRYRDPAGVDSLEDIVSSLSTTAYMAVLEQLPKIKLDSSKDIIGLLQTVIKYRIMDERAHQFRRESRYASLPDNIDSLPEVVDPHSQSFENQIADREYVQQLLGVIQDYWKNNLSPADRQIAQYRYQDPPLPFSEIATKLGPSTTETSVRQRHHRILQLTRSHLKNSGLL